MQGLGKVLLTGAAVIVMWKVLAGLFVGVMALAFKVGLILLAGYLLIQFFNGRKKKKEG
jgi:hypothetical protein